VVSICDNTREIYKKNPRRARTEIPTKVFRDVRFCTIYTDIIIPFNRVIGVKFNLQQFLFID